MLKYASGAAITNAIKTSLADSMERSFTIWNSDAPITLRTPISLVLRSAVNEAIPNSPKHATRIASPEKAVATCPSVCSAT